MKKYSSEMAISILAMIQANIYTIGEICAAHGINRRTFSRWRNKYPRFAAAIEEIQDDNIERMNIDARNGLMKRLKGYTAQICSIKRNEHGEIVKETILTKHIAPDTGTIIFVLTNGDTDHWKNRQNAELTGANGEPLFPPARILTKKEAREFLHPFADSIKQSISDDDLKGIKVIIQ